MTRPLAVWLDDYAIQTLPGIESDLAQASAIVMRSFARVPNPSTVAQLEQYQQVAIIGGKDFHHLVARVEMATTSLKVAVIAALPPGVADSKTALRGPGVVDVIGSGLRQAASRVVLMSSVPIVTGRASRPDPGPKPDAPAATYRALSLPALGGWSSPKEGQGRPVAFASSTGGCWVLAEILCALKDRGVGPVLVAQHMDSEFVEFFARWLSSTTGLASELVGAEVPLAPRTLYIATGGQDLCVSKDGRSAFASPSTSRFIPSADRLLESFAAGFGSRGTAVVLSGMGNDGARGLAQVVRSGGTGLCQLPSSAIVSSMPECALGMAPGAIALPPELLPAAISELR